MVEVEDETPQKKSVTCFLAKMAVVLSKNNATSFENNIHLFPWLQLVGRLAQHSSSAVFQLQLQPPPKLGRAVAYLFRYLRAEFQGCLKLKLKHAEGCHLFLPKMAVVLNICFVLFCVA